MKTQLLRSIALALALSAFSATPLSAATADELLAGLRVELEKSLVEAKATKGSAGSNTAYEIERQVSRLDAAVAKDNFEEIEQVLNQLALTRLSVEAKERISQFQRELPKLVEERQKAFAAQVTATIEKAAKACLAAKAESDLDPVVAELAALKKQRADGASAYSEARQRIMTRIDGSTRFVNRWQDYLIQMARGYEATARNVLRELADPQGNQYYPILPRAEIVARLGKDQDVTADDILRQVKTLDDIPKAIAELTRLSKENSVRTVGMQDFNTPLNELNQIARAYAAFKGGQYGAALGTTAQWESAGGQRSVETTRLKQMLLMAVLPRYLGLSDNPQPKAGENQSDFLLRLAEEGVAQKDWSRVARALDAYRLTAFGYRQPPAWVTNEIEASLHFVAGQNLEKAGRFAPAILAYQRAVKVTGKYSPQAAATERLSALEKEQPAAFAEAGKEPQLRELIETLRSNPTPRTMTLGAPVFE